MSALPRSPDEAPQVRFEQMTPAWLDAVIHIEHGCYSHPWNRVHFLDSLKSGYACQMLVADQTLIGYFVAMKGVDEVHLLNITVAPQLQRQGWARMMLDGLVLWARRQNAEQLWLEVRVSNERAVHVYEQCGFKRVGKRRDYYPLALGRREDALVMSLML